MECVGARNFAAMAFTAFPSRSSRPAVKRYSFKNLRCGLCSRVVRASVGSGSESCVAVREDYADEEDFVKAGGSEIMFVQMQQNKDMDEQSNLVDKLPPISVGDGGALDLVVIGCGPAGLALAAESAKLGLKVGLIGPDLPFTNNYGVWEDEFNDLGLQKCIEHVWRDTIVYLDDNNPITIGRAYGRVNRRLLHEELLRRCAESGVSYLCSKVESITEAPDGLRLVACEKNTIVPCRLATVASGAASGKLLQYELGGPRVCVQTAYGVEVEVENSPYDPEQMVFMDYRDYTNQKVRCLEAEYPTFLYAMPMTKTRVFFEEWSYIPVGGSLPNTEQKNLAFGAAASMVHPATGCYSVVRSLSEAPNYASVIADILKHDTTSFTKHINTNISRQAWDTLWPQERKRQRAFFLFGLALIVQLDIGGIRSFFHTFFRLPKWMWQGFLGSTLTSGDLVLFAFYMFIIAPNNLRKGLINHLVSDPTGATMIKTYLRV
ncbi:hypothetical protein F2Q70_00007896 [Brassica cretica]|uniref:Lycopene epsilon-cyclase n=2 Tax=Brassica cretica TaxID=69181 RepID=A0A8S9MF72_BRACR|nr:hypothetical protein F2Q70_00007896 [Brassica cretica]